MLKLVKLINLLKVVTHYPPVSKACNEGENLINKKIHTPVGQVCRGGLSFILAQQTYSRKVKT